MWSTARRATSRIILGVILAVGALWWSVSPVAAELTGNCEGSGAFSQGTDADGPLTVDARTVGTETVVIPRKDSVQWAGSVTSPPGAYAGFVAIDLPPPFGEVNVDSWSGTTQATENTGVKDYDVPKLVPAGATFRVVGEHHDQATQCAGFVNVKLEGGAFKSPVTPVALLLTAFAGVGFGLAIQPLFRKGPR